MNDNPFLGVLFHWLGGLASGSVYAPYRCVKKWAWEVYWLVGGVFSWVLVPWILALSMTEDLIGVLGRQSASSLWWTYFFGALWRDKVLRWDITTLKVVCHLK
jgi:L-rhamnose-H+ transport protein